MNIAPLMPSGGTTDYDRLLTRRLQEILVNYATEINKRHSGTYTPTLTNVTNVSASTAFACQYMVVENVVTVSGLIQADPTAAGLAQVGISLPIPSALSIGSNCAGTGCGYQTSEAASINGDTGNGRANLAWVAADLTNHFITFHFTYQIL